MTFENKIKELGLVLPKATPPVGSYVELKLLESYLIYLDKYRMMKMEN